MPREYRFQFPLPNGLHARPASYLVEAVTGRFGAEFALVNERSGRTANAKSVLSMVAADVKRDDHCRVVISGPDEDAALTAVSAFLRDVFPHCDPAPAATSEEAAQELLPRSLQAAGLGEHYRGTCASPGIGWGRVVCSGGLVHLADLGAQQPSDPRTERGHFDAAIAALRRRTEARIASSTNVQEIGILKAHLSIISDIALADEVHQLIARDARTAAQAVVAAGEYFAGVLRAAQSAYVRERVLDVQDVCAQLVELICGRDQRAAPLLTEPAVCVADHLTPGQFLALDRRHLKGFVLRQGGTTSHTIILARSMGVPALVGVHEALDQLRAAQEIIVDANLGIVVPRITEPLRRYYHLETQKLRRMQEKLAESRQRTAVTGDGRRVEVGANIGWAEEARPALDNGADGIGLFRTEMLFMDRNAPPTEDEQVEMYARAARAADERPLTIRLLDVGGDKPLPYLKLAQDANPFLGYRGVRIYAEHAALMRSQLRATLRAARAGNVRILVPMVSAIDELRLVKRMLEQARQELVSEGISCRQDLPLGVMIEVPSAAFMIRELAGEVDFFSVGSNDLAQYFLAADRDNRKVSSLYGWQHPSFLRLLKQIAQEAAARGKRLELCGEMAESDAALPLLIGLGLDELSVPAPRVPAVKRAIRGARFDRCVELLERAVNCATRQEVEYLLQQSHAHPNGQPLLCRELLLESRAASKAEVIKELTDSLWLTGRVQHAHLLEESVWQREDKYSTGFGHGFALPHCKSEHLDANSIAVARLAEPVDWGSADGKPVDVVILLAIRAQDHGKDHMRIFSQLSRLVMRDPFRDRIREEADPGTLLAFLEESLGLGAAVS